MLSCSLQPRTRPQRQTTRYENAHWRPRGSGIGSSNSCPQPLLVTPALLVELRHESVRQPRRAVLIRQVTPRASSTRTPAVASVVALPRSAGVTFTHPAAVLA